MSANDKTQKYLDRLERAWNEHRSSRQCRKEQAQYLRATHGHTGPPAGFLHLLTELNKAIILAIHAKYKLPLTWRLPDASLSFLEQSKWPISCVVGPLVTRKGGRPYTEDKADPARQDIVTAVHNLRVHPEREKLDTPMPVQDIAAQFAINRSTVFRYNREALAVCSDCRRSRR
jgi:hypothetical protein